MIEIETQLRGAIRDAVNRPSRKPLHWGGLAGYQQLEGIAQALQAVPAEDHTAYLLRLASQVNRVVDTNRLLAQDVAAAHAELTQIAACLRYPPSAFPASNRAEPLVTSDLVRREMDALLEHFQPDLKRQPAQAALASAWHRLWQTCGPDLLPCYDIRGLPPDNLKLEALFEELRNHQRRISGRKSTRPLRDFGQSQVLFDAQNEAELWQQLQHVPLAEYELQRQRLAKAEEPRQNLSRLHRDPAKAARQIIEQHAARRAELTQALAAPPP